jgi:hypothetical protein
MKNSTFLTILAFCFLTAAFGMLIVGAWLNKGQVWTKLFALFFTLGATAFWGWLAAENRENKTPWKNKGKIIIKK